MSDTSRRAILMGGAVAAVGLTAAACDSSKTGGKVTQPAGNTNDMINQQAKLTITAWNAVKDSPGQAYPDTLLKSSLELKQQRERLLRFNTDSKQGWLYLFSQTGVMLAQFTIQGKVSSTESSMTATDLVYSNTDGSTSVIAGPGDDLSFGQNEGAVFWFDDMGVMGMWNGPWLYLDAPLDVPDEVKASALATKPGAKPSSVAQGSTLF